MHLMVKTGSMENWDVNQAILGGLHLVQCYCLVSKCEQESKPMRIRCSLLI